MDQGEVRKVPGNREAGSGAILALYGLEPRAVEAVTDNPKKPVWRVATAGDEFYLKRMHTSSGRLRFILAANEHLNRRGIKTPPVVPTRGGDPFATWNGQLYVLTRAVGGQALGLDQHMELITRSLAHFHRASRGFRPPPEAEVHSHLGTWPDQYEKKLTELDEFAEQATSGPPNPFHELYLAEVGHFKEQIQSALQLLGTSYDAWVRRCEKDGVLCHQDYAASNLRLVKGQVVVFDLDAVTCDLPARDLRKHLNKVMKKSGWDVDRTRRILQWYSHVEPLDANERQVLWADLWFPQVNWGQCLAGSVARPGSAPRGHAVSR